MIGVGEMVELNFIKTLVFSHISLEAIDEIIGWPEVVKYRPRI
jgi:hypothetical protein